jgi:hypothetical protein
MMKTLIGAAMTASVALTGIAAAPASAQDRNGYSGYDSRYEGGYQDRGYRGDGYYEQRDYRDARRHYRNRRCSSGTTGAIVGGILGALLGREIGRGGRYNRPSGTSAIVGAGAGALVGREIDRGDCRR